MSNLSTKQADRRNTEDGFVALQWALGVGLFLIPVFMLMSSVTLWPERQSIARSIAEESARSAVNAPTLDDALAISEEIAFRNATNLGLDPAEVSVTVSIEEWLWGNDVVVTVDVSMPLLNAGALGSFGAAPWSTTATGRIDDYRSLP